MKFPYTIFLEKKRRLSSSRYKKHTHAFLANNNNNDNNNSDRDRREKKRDSAVRVLSLFGAGDEKRSPKAFLSFFLFFPHIFSLHFDAQIIIFRAQSQKTTS